jgi:hypothetical protein
MSAPDNAARYAAEHGKDLDETITRRELIAMVDDHDEGMDNFMEWLTGERNAWPNWVEHYR